MNEGGGIPAMDGLNHKVHLYLESHSVFPLDRIGPPTPLPQVSVTPPHPRNQRGGGLQGKEHTRLWVRGWGSQYGRVEKNPRTLSILWFKRSMLSKSSNDQRNIKVGFF
jgi:hypothetical protein